MKPTSSKNALLTFKGRREHTSLVWRENEMLQAAAQARRTTDMRTTEMRDRTMLLMPAYGIVYDHLGL